MELVEIVILAVVIALVAVGLVGGLVVGSRKKKLPPPPPSAPTITPPAEPQVGEEAETPRDEARRTIDEVGLPDATAPAEEAPVAEAPAPPALEVPEPTAGRLVRLRARLARSQNSLGKGLLTLLSRDNLDEDTWEEIEDTLLTADVGVAPTQELVERLRERVRVLGTRTPEDLRNLLREELITLLGPDFDREVKTEGGAETPGVVMVVGVNGTGKTTTTGKLARVLVADGRSVVLGAADTFRAAAADQLQTWGERVGARTVRGPEGGDPASIAYDAVKEGIAEGADVVLIDTAWPCTPRPASWTSWARSSASWRSTARWTRSCSCSTRPPDRTASSRPGCSRRSWTSPASSSPSSTAPPRAASSSRSSASWAYR